MKIVIDHLSKSYGQQKAVDELSFSVDTGEVVGFLGPNGAGKTTTMKMITNYLEIESGEITIGPYAVKSEADKIKRHIGYLPENNPLYLDMPVVDYLEFCAALQGVPKQQIAHRVRKMISLCGINQEKHKKIGALSKGYRQRVGLAQAMIHDPSILILDEPTTGLDPNQIVEIRNLIREMGQNKTVVLSTHILPEVEATCDRILIINRGKIVADGTSESLKKKSSGERVYRIRLSTPQVEQVVNYLNSIQEISSVRKNNDNRLVEVEVATGYNFPEKLFQACISNNWYIEQLTPVESSLEDIFRGLTMS